MFEKDNKFYADWRNKKGQRKRKSFTSKRAALQFESEQKELAHPKQTARRTPSQRSYSPREGSRTATPSLTLPKHSSGLRVISRPKS